MFIKLCMFLEQTGKRMGRTQKKRIIKEPPIFTEFKPTGIAGRLVERITLSLDEYEALRLSDFMGMSQVEAAEEMEISRPTFSRLIDVARQKISEVLVRGKMLVIEGGNIHFKRNIIKCRNCGHMFNTDFYNSVKRCLVCDSDELINLAGGFGHGRCCQRRNRR